MPALRFFVGAWAFPETLLERVALFRSRLLSAFGLAPTSAGISARKPSKTAERDFALLHPPLGDKGRKRVATVLSFVHFPVSSRWWERGIMIAC